MGDEYLGNGISSSPSDSAAPSKADASPAPQSGGGGDSGVKQLQDYLKFYSQPHRELKMPPVKETAKQGKIGTNIAMGALAALVPFAGGAVARGVKAQRETMINDVVSKFQSLGNEMEMAEYVSQGDPKKKEEYLNSSPVVKALFADKKFLKGMQKVFGGDLMSPEKQNTVFHEGIKRYVSTKKAAEQLKELHGKKPQPKEGGQEQSQVGTPQQGAQPQQGAPQGGQPQGGGQPSPAEMLSKMPQGLSMPDPSKIASLENSISMAENREANQKQKAGPKYTMKQDAQGNWFYADEHDPSAPIKPLLDEKGRAVTGKTQSDMKIGRMEKGAGGQPVAIWGRTPDGNIAPLTPGDPGWTGANQKEFDMAKAAYDTNQKNIEKRINTGNRIKGEIYAKTRAEYTMVDVLDTQTQTLQRASMVQIHEDPTRYVGANPAMNVLNQQKIYSEIEVSMSQLDDEIKKLPDTPFDAETRTKFLLALRDEDPHSAFNGFIKSEAANKLTDEQVEYLTALANMNESAFALRSAGGQGAGSDMLRSAIRNMVPSGSTPSKKYAMSQMRRLKAQVQSLKVKVPRLGQEGQTRIYKEGEVPD
jgi:hypothetical protein